MTKLIYHNAVGPAVHASYCGKRVNYNFLYRAAMLVEYSEAMGRGEETQLVVWSRDHFQISFSIYSKASLAEKSLL